MKTFVFKGLVGEQIENVEQMNVSISNGKTYIILQSHTTDNYKVVMKKDAGEETYVVSVTEAKRSFEDNCYFYQRENAETVYAKALREMKKIYDHE